MATMTPEHTFTPYRAGARLFCDFLYSKPLAKCLEVIEKGDGKGIAAGKIRVQLTETVRGYDKGEILILSAVDAVPLAQEMRLRAGQFTRRVSTLYRWVKA